MWMPELSPRWFSPLTLEPSIANDPNVSVVNRDSEAFFRATYLTADLHRLLKKPLASLAGKPGYNRVLKLRTPFGGGKSQPLAALLHAKKRNALDNILEAKGFPGPTPGNLPEKLRPVN
jgi:hypothetical protein